MANDLIKLGGLWKNTDKNGKTYLAGKLSPGVKILIFPNQYRETENQPTHIMYLSQVETQDQSQVPEQDDFDPNQAPRRGYAPAEEYAEPAPAQQRPMAPRSAAPPPRTPAPSRPPHGRHRQPAPPPDYNMDGLDDPFAE